MQKAIHMFVRDAFKQEFPKEVSTPKVTDTEEKNANPKQPNGSDCGLFAVTKVMQLVR